MLFAAELLIRPAVNFKEGHHYVVVLRKLKDVDGKPIPAQTAFRACRDQLATMLPPVQDRCAELAANPEKFIFHVPSSTARELIKSKALTADGVVAWSMWGPAPRGVYAVVTPEQCVTLAEEVGPSGGLVLHPLMGGMPPILGWESLELFASKVLPNLS